ASRLNPRWPAIRPMSSSVSPGCIVLQQLAQRVQSILPNASACSSPARWSMAAGAETTLRLRRKRKLASSCRLAFVCQSRTMASCSSFIASLTFSGVGDLAGAPGRPGDVAPVDDVLSLVEPPPQFAGAEEVSRRARQQLDAEPLVRPELSHPDH